MRKDPMKYCLTLLALIISMAATAKPSASSSFRYFDEKSGLSNGFVVSMTQDRDGYLWVATEDGLNRFDGHRFKQYNKDNSGLSANELNCVAYDPAYADTVWIATQRNGVCVYDRLSGEISTLDADRLPKDVTKIVPATDGGMWMSAYNTGVYYYNPATKELKEYRPSTIAGLPTGAWTVAANHDALYIGHKFDGFSVVDTATVTARTYTVADGLPGNTVYAIYIDKNDNVWLGTDRGAALYNPATGKISPIFHCENNKKSLGAGRVWDIKEVGDDELWFATSQDGISILDTRKYDFEDVGKARFRNIQSNNGWDGTSSINARCILQDRYGNVWVGNYLSGVDMISHIDPLISKVNTRRLGHNNQVWSCTSTPDGAHWLGSDDCLIKIKDNKITTTALPPTRFDTRSIVKSLYFDKAGTLWIGTMEKGVLLMDCDGNISELSGTSPDIRVFFEVSPGTMLIGCVDGIYIADKDGVRPYAKINDQLSDPIVNSIQTDSEGNLWVGTFGRGLNIFDEKQRRTDVHNIDSGFISNAINDIVRDRRGRMWIATRNGVTMFDRGETDSTYHTFTQLAQAGVNQIKAIEEDRYGNMWLSTNNSLVCINGNTLEVSNFNNYERTPISTFIDRLSMTDKAGNIFFSTCKDIYSIHPDMLGVQIKPDDVVVTELTMLGSDERAAAPEAVRKGHISLPYDDNSFAITFNILDPTKGNLTDIAYRLRGAGDTWIENTGDNTATYRNLPPGKYQFEVRQRFKGQSWGKQASILTIDVKPPLWLTWWAKTAYLLLATLVIFYIARTYKRRVNLREKLETEMHKSENKQKLNEERLRFYTNITHELRTPLTLIMGPLEDLVSDPALPAQYSYKLQVIRDSTTTLLNLINGILEFRKTETQNRHLTVKKGNLSNLIREISLRYKELNRNPDVKFVLDIEDDPTPLYFDTDMITTILNNLLSNAMKYTASGSITISYHHETTDNIRHSVIRVKDTGYGISEKGLAHIFQRYYQVDGKHQASGTGIGLALVKNLADLHQAEISVASELDKGSTFTLSLLSDNLYPNAIHKDEIAQPDTSQATVTEEESTAPDRRVKLLIVEDNDDIREYICQALEDEFDVTSARNGLEGLKKAQELHPDLVISDIMMPEMDGIEMCRSIKEDIVTSHIQVILLTAKDSIPDREEGYEAGADSYLTKPFSAKLLRSRIYSLLRIRRLLATQFMSTDVDTDKEPSPEQPQPPHSSETENALSPLDREFMSKILDIINENIANEELNVPFIATRMCMSSSTLYRKINAIVGVSTNEYIRHLRLMRAAELIIAGDMPITNIAESVGFGTHSSFAKAFKKEFGMTATEYHQKKRNNNI